MSESEKGRRVGSHILRLLNRKKTGEAQQGYERPGYMLLLWVNASCSDSSLLSVSPLHERTIPSAALRRNIPLDGVKC